jgi:transposase-like protein
MKRRTLSPEFKKKVAIEALREHRTINEIASEHQLHPVQVSKWKKELINGAVTIFEDPRKKKGELKNWEKQEAILQQKIGQLIVEIDWIKKKTNV